MRENDSSGEEVKEEQGNQESESEKYRYHRAKGERGERKRKVSDSLSSSARNRCPEIRRTIRGCQDQHTHGMQRPSRINTHTL